MNMCSADLCPLMATHSVDICTFNIIIFISCSCRLRPLIRRHLMPADIDRISGSRYRCCSDPAMVDPLVIAGTSPSSWILHQNPEHTSSSTPLPSISPALMEGDLIDSIDISVFLVDFSRVLFQIGISCLYLTGGNHGPAASAGVLAVIIPEYWRQPP